MTLKMRHPAPQLDFSLTDGSHWRLSAQEPRAYTMIVFYRGLHCPLCRAYLGELNGKLSDFETSGVNVVAVSADDEQRAQQSKTEWALTEISLGYGLSTDVARQWGLFISKAIRDGETPEFFEPGLFLIQPDGNLFYAAINSAPWGRPSIDQVLSAAKMSAQRGSPARGEA